MTKAAAPVPGSFGGATAAISSKATWLFRAPARAKHLSPPMAGGRGLRSKSWLRGRRLELFVWQRRPLRPNATALGWFHGHSNTTEGETGDARQAIAN